MVYLHSNSFILSLFYFTVNRSFSAWPNLVSHKICHPFHFSRVERCCFRSQKQLEHLSGRNESHICRFCSLQWHKPLLNQKEIYQMLHVVTCHKRFQATRRKIYFGKKWYKYHVSVVFICIWHKQIYLKYPNHQFKLHWYTF